MKLEATCLNCRRRFLLAQIQPEPDGTGGRCPFCGHRFARHYVQALPHIVDAAETAASAFVTAMARLHDMQPGFQVDYPALLKRMSEDLSLPSERSA
jgi:hypothetical protein